MQKLYINDNTENACSQIQKYEILINFQEFENVFNWRFPIES